jgi:transposase
MDTMTVAIDLAKSVFEIAVADSSWRITERRRLSRLQLERFFITRSVSHVVMEACGSSHHWGRWLQARGIQVSLLPAQYVRAYVRRDKTDRTNAAALLEAVRCGEIRPVCVKSVEQQALQGLHRVRSAHRGDELTCGSLHRRYCACSCLLVISLLLGSVRLLVKPPSKYSRRGEWADVIASARKAISRACAAA